MGAVGPVSVLALVVAIHLFAGASQGKVWYVHNLLKYEFDLEFDLPVRHPRGFDWQQVALMERFNESRSQVSRVQRLVERPRLIDGDGALCLAPCPPHITGTRQTPCCFR